MNKATIEPQAIELLTKLLNEVSIDEKMDSFTKNLIIHDLNISISKVKKEKPELELRRIYGLIAIRLLTAPVKFNETENELYNQISQLSLQKVSFSNNLASSLAWGSFLLR